jgi:hypothetical protein
MGVPSGTRSDIERLEREGLARLLAAVRETDVGPAPPVQVGRLAALWLLVRGLGAGAVLAVGAIHLQQYVVLYSAVPTIGTLFLLNFAGATVIGLGLLAPLERLLGARWGAAAVGMLALAGIVLAAVALVFLTIAEHTPLFGFLEPGYHPGAILASRVAEVAAIVLLGSFLVGRLLSRAPKRHW